MRNNTEQITKTAQARKRFEKRFGGKRRRARLPYLHIFLYYSSTECQILCTQRSVFFSRCAGSSPLSQFFRPWLLLRVTVVRLSASIWEPLTVVWVFGVVIMTELISSPMNRGIGLLPPWLPSHKMNALSGSLPRIKPLPTLKTPSLMPRG